jgi:protein-S-isoprenylcysteine O-methyltransferase Ste14
MRLYRPATRSSTSWVAAKTAASIVVVWSLALWILPVMVDRVARRWVPSWTRFDPVRPLAVGLFIGGSVCGLSAATTMTRHGRGTPLPFDAATELVHTGMYAVVRNPMAVSAICQSIGVGVWFGSWPIVGYSAAAGLLWHAVIRPSEERFLHNQFGAPYDEYRKRVGLWLPRRR